MDFIRDDSVTAWVLEHPAHLQLLAGFIREGTQDDMYILTRRKECLAMFAESTGHLPVRQVVEVERPFGPGIGRLMTLRLAMTRRRKVIAALRDRTANGVAIERLIGMGTSIELMAAKRAGVAQRWYISDTEVSHLAHRLALRHATDVVLPTYWRADLDGGFLDSLASSDIRVHRHGRLHAEFRHEIEARDSKNSVLVRRLEGGGSHDGPEIISLDGVLSEVDHEMDFADENGEISNRWELPRRLASYAGVITQSTTLAVEAASTNVPTLLVSAAERGFIDHARRRGMPLIQSRFPQGHGRELERWKTLVRRRDSIVRPQIWENEGLPACVETLQVRKESARC